MTHNVCTRNQTISEKEVRIHYLKFVSLLVKRNQEKNTPSTQKICILSTKVYLGVEISQMKKDKALIT